MHESARYFPGKAFGMKFVTIRELRSNTATIRKELEKAQDIVVTANGRPFALLTKLDADHLEEQLAALRRARARQALDRVREAAKAGGLETMSMPEIDQLVARTRRDRSSPSRRGG